MISILYNADAKSVEVSSQEVRNPYGDGRKVNVSITIGNDYLHLDSLDREQLVTLIDGLEAAFHRIVDTGERGAEADAVPVGTDEGDYCHKCGKYRYLCDCV